MRKVMYMMGILNDDDVAWLCAHGERKCAPAGSELIREGERVDSLFVLLEGELAVRTREGGDVARLYAGEIVGEISFVDQRPPTATVAAVRNSQVLAIAGPALRAKLARYDGFAGRFYHSVALFLADRLRSNLNHSKGSKEDDSEDLDEQMLDQAGFGALRFDKLLKAQV